MKLLNTYSIALGLGLVALLGSAKAEARAHFGFGFSAPVVVAERACMTPCYVEECYPCEQQVIVQRGPCGDEHVYVGQRPCYREVYVRPVYRERVYVYPRPSFSFGFGFFR